MCGRTALALEPEEIRAHVPVREWRRQDLYRPSFNVGPTRYQPVLRQEGHATILECMVTVSLP